MRARDLGANVLILTGITVSTSVAQLPGQQKHFIRQVFWLVLFPKDSFGADAFPFPLGGTVAKIVRQH